MAVVFTAMAFGRIIQDTTFTSSPTRFVSTAIMAAVCWLLYDLHTRRLREAGLPRRAKR